MERGAWWAADHGVAESGTTDQLTHIPSGRILQALPLIKKFFPMSNFSHNLKNTEVLYNI